MLTTILTNFIILFFIGVFMFSKQLVSQKGTLPLLFLFIKSENVSENFQEGTTNYNPATQKVNSVGYFVMGKLTNTMTVKKPGISSPDKKQDQN